MPSLSEEPMSAKNLEALSSLSGLRRVARGPWGRPAAAGRIDGFPVAAAYVQINRRNGVAFLVRFAKGSWSGGPEGLAAFARESESLKEALGKKEVPKDFLKSLTLLPDGFTAFWPYSLFQPKPPAVLAVLKALLQVAAKGAKPMDTGCEACGKDSREGLWLADGVPMTICGGCRQGQDAEAQRRQEAYDRLESNLFLGAIYGLVTAAVLAAAWGGIAFAINRIFLWGAIGIGIALAWAVNKGMEKVNTAGRAMTVALTLTTVLAGDYLFILLSASREVEGGLSLRLASAVARQFWAIEFNEGSGWLSLLFALVGAGYILYVNRPPRFQVRYEPLG